MRGFIRRFTFSWLRVRSLLLILTIVNVVRHYRQLEAWILLLMGILFFHGGVPDSDQSAAGAGPADPAGRTAAIAGAVVGGA